MKIGIVSLGCAKNLVDSEIALGILSKEGHTIVSDPSRAEIIIVNTCGFIEAAKEESIGAILEMAQYKEKGRCRGLIVMGCLSQRYAQELWTELPEIDALLGVNELDSLNEVIAGLGRHERAIRRSDNLFDYDRVFARLLSAGPHLAYLKIAEGCSHACAFCVIPKIRGRYRSRSPRVLMEEAGQLAAAGVQELTVIAQDTTAYGRAAGTSIVELLGDLAKLDIPWIRLLYTHPAFISTELLELIAATPNVVKYVDLPLQHVSAPILQAMKRPGNMDSFGRLIEKIRTLIPGVVIRSSFIVGFPGETEEHFDQLLSFLEQQRLDHVGIFEYSREENSAAYNLPKQVPQRVKKERYRRAMDVQRRISLELNEVLLGKQLPVLLESYSEESDLVLIGRHRGQAPDVDGVVYLGRNDQRPGKIVTARIIEAHPYDLVGEVVEV